MGFQWAELDATLCFKLNHRVIEGVSPSLPIRFYMSHRVINGARKSMTIIIANLDLSYSLEKFAASVVRNFL